MRPKHGAFPLLSLLATACVAWSPNGEADGSADPAATEPSRAGGEAVQAGGLVPAGYGTLTQERISVALDSGALRIRITPLSERLLRAAAPDTYRRLHRLQTGALSDSTDVRASRSLFLVTFFSREANHVFSPEAVSLQIAGRRYRPLRIQPVTGGWGLRRLAQQASQSAIFVYPSEVEPGRDLTLGYGDVRSRAWEGIRAEIESELVRARARAGGPVPPGAHPRASATALYRSNLRIFR